MRQKPPIEWPALMAALIVGGLPAGFVTYVVWREFGFRVLIAAGAGLAVAVIVCATLGLTRPDDHNMVIVAFIMFILASIAPWGIRIFEELIGDLKDLYESLSETLGPRSARWFLAIGVAVLLIPGFVEALGSLMKNQDK